MAYTRNWDESQPQDHTKLSDVPPWMRTIKIDVAQRLKDWIYGFISGETKIGLKKAPLYPVSSDPATESDKGILYVKEVDGVKELFYKDSSGNVKQLTVEGKLNIENDEAVLLTGDQTIHGIKKFMDKVGIGTDSPRNLLEVSGADRTLAIVSGPNTAGNAVGDFSISTKTDEQLVNEVKNWNISFRTDNFGVGELGSLIIYCDKKVGENFVSQFGLGIKKNGDVYFGSYSKSTNGYTKLPNGLILQWGVGDTATGAHSVCGYIYFPMSFPNACFQVVVTPVYTVSGWGPPRFCVSSVSSSSFHYCLDAGFNGPSINNSCKLRFIAVGY